MNNKYAKLDAAIVAAIAQDRYSPMYNYQAYKEASNVSTNNFILGVDQIISKRTQALRKAGKIQYLKKSEAPNGKCGWYLVGVNDSG